jgi:AraC-like DNA-binding protein
MPPYFSRTGAINPCTDRSDKDEGDSSKKKDWMRVLVHSTRFICTEANFVKYGYERHRHDAYAVGITTEVVQSTNYRGSLIHSCPGDTMVIHPDEYHDGRAGTDSGYCYRIVHIQPEILHEVLGGSSLPILKEGISRNAELHRAASLLLNDFVETTGTLEQDDLLFDLAIALRNATDGKSKKGTGNIRAAMIARDYIHSQPTERIELDILSKISGRDRWNLSRDFRQYFGTSPSRYMTLRRLDIAKRLMLSDLPLVECAATVGFSDQSHMTRQFINAFGLTPSRWLSMQRSAPRGR